MGCRVVVIFAANGNVDTGVTDQTLELTSVTDVGKIQAVKNLAHRVLDTKKKVEVRNLLAASILELVGPVDAAQIRASPLLAQEARKIRLEISRIVENVENITRIAPKTELERKARDYLLWCATRLQTAMRSHILRHLTKGDLPKEALSFATALLEEGVPKAVYTKLIQPNLIEGLTTRLDQVLFGTKISRSLKLTYEECNSPVMNVQLLSFFLVRNGKTLRAARSADLREQMVSLLEEGGIKRLNKIQLTMVGPVDLSKDWANAQPHAPIGTGVVGEALLRINAAEFDYNSGILPMLTKATDYWNGAIVRDKGYEGNLATVMMAVITDAKEVQPNNEGFTYYPRDTIRAALDKALTPFRDILPPGDFKAEALDLRTTFGVVPLGNVPRVETETKVDPKSQTSIDWKSMVIGKIFLKSVPDAPKSKESGNTPKIRLGTKITREIVDMGLDEDLQHQLVSLLMQFQSSAMMKQAFTSFAAEVERMILDGSFIAPLPGGGRNLIDNDDDSDEDI